MPTPSKPISYVGINNEINAGMTDTAKIIRDAWAFGIIPETETCEGWIAAGLEDLWRKNQIEWEKAGFLVSGMPDDVRERFMRIQDKAFKDAKAAGWDPELGDDG